MDMFDMVRRDKDDFLNLLDNPEQKGGNREGDQLNLVALAQGPADALPKSAEATVNTLLAANDEGKVRLGELIRQLLISGKTEDKTDGERLLKLIRGNDIDVAVGIAAFENPARCHAVLEILWGDRWPRARGTLQEMLRNPESAVAVGTLAALLTSPDVELQRRGERALFLLNGGIAEDKVEQAKNSVAARRLLEACAIDTSALKAMNEITGDPKRQKVFRDIRELLVKDVTADNAVRILRLFANPSPIAQDNAFQLLDMMKSGGRITRAAESILRSTADPDHIHQLVRLYIDPYAHSQREAVFDKLIQMFSSSKNSDAARAFLDLAKLNFEPENQDRKTLTSLLSGPDANDATRLLRLVTAADHRHALLEHFQTAEGKLAVPRILNLLEGGMKERRAGQEMVHLLRHTTAEGREIGAALLKLMAGNEEQQHLARAAVTHFEDLSERRELLRLSMTNPDLARRIIGDLGGQHVAAAKGLVRYLAFEREEDLKAAFGKVAPRLEPLDARRESRSANIAMLSEMYSKPETAGKARSILTALDPREVSQMLKVMRGLAGTPIPEQLLRMLDSPDFRDHKAVRALLQSPLDLDGIRQKKATESDEGRLLLMLGTAGADREAAQKILRHLDPGGQRSLMLQLLDTHKDTAGELFTWLEDRNKSDMARAMLALLPSAEAVKDFLAIVKAHPLSEMQLRQLLDSGGAYNLMLMRLDIGPDREGSRRVAQEMLAKLNNPDEWRIAASWLGVGLSAKEILKLKELLADEKTHKGAQTLSELLVPLDMVSDAEGIKHSASAHSLLGLLTDSDPVIRESGMRIFELLQGGDDRSRALSLFSVSLGGAVENIAACLNDPQQAQGAREILKLLENGQDREKVGDFIRRFLGKEHPELKKTVLQMLSSHDTKANDLAKNMIRVFERPLEYQAFLRLVDGSAEKTAQERRLSDQLLLMVKSKDPAVTRGLINLLEIVDANGPAAGPLLHLLASDHKDSQKRALTVLSKLSDSQALEALVTLGSEVETMPIAERLVALLGKGYKHQAQVNNFLSRLWILERGMEAPMSNPALRPLLSLLADPDQAKLAEEAIVSTNNSVQLEMLGRLLAESRSNPPAVSVPRPNGKEMVRALVQMLNSKEAERARFADLVLENSASPEDVRAMIPVFERVSGTAKGAILHLLAEVKPGRMSILTTMLSQPLVSEQRIAGERLLRMLENREEWQTVQNLLNQLDEIPLRLVDVLDSRQAAGVVLRDLLRSTSDESTAALQNLAAMLNGSASERDKAERVIALMNTPGQTEAALRELAAKVR